MFSSAVLNLPVAEAAGAAFTQEFVLNVQERVHPNVPEANPWVVQL